MLKNLIAASLLGLLSLTANATQFVLLEVNQQAGIFSVHVEMYFEAPAERVRSILTDYENLDLLNASITSSKVIGTNHNGSVRVLTRFRNCVLLFCMDIQKVEDITEDEHGRILVAMVPESSNFHSGQTSWEVLSSGSGSRVILHANMEPDLWLPSWLSGAIIKNTLRREIQESFENLECLALRDHQPLPVNNQDKAWDGVNRDI